MSLNNLEQFVQHWTTQKEHRSGWTGSIFRKATVTVSNVEMATTIREIYKIAAPQWVKNLSRLSVSAWIALSAASALWKHLEHLVYQHFSSPPFYEMSRTTPKHLHPRNRQAMPILLNFTNIYPHQLCFYVIEFDKTCIALQYFKWSNIHDYSQQDAVRQKQIFT